MTFIQYARQHYQSMRYLNNIHPFYDDQQVTVHCGVKPVSSNVNGTSVEEESFLTVT